MNPEHRHLGPLGWFLYVLSLLCGYLESHLALIVSIVCALTGCACHVIQTRLKIKEYEDRKRENELREKGRQ